MLCAPRPPAPAPRRAGWRSRCPTARERIRLPSGGYRHDHLRAQVQRAQADECKVRIVGSKGDLLRTLANAVAATGAVPSFVPEW